MKTRLFFFFFLAASFIISFDGFGFAKTPKNKVIEIAAPTQSAGPERNQNPGYGVLISDGNTYKVCVLYFWSEETKNWEKLKEFTLKPGYLGRITEIRYGQVMRKDEQYIKLPFMGQYKIIVFPYRQTLAGKKYLPQREYYIYVDSNPTDYVYRGKYVGWHLEIYINDYTQYGPRVSVRVW